LRAPRHASYGLGVRKNHLGPWLVGLAALSASCGADSLEEERQTPLAQDSGDEDAGPLDPVVDGNDGDVTAADEDPDAANGDASNPTGDEDGGDASAPSDDDPATCVVCTSYAPMAEVGRVSTSDLTEISGLALSRTQPNIVFTHNDSGHPSELFALRTSGELLGVYALEGAPNRDWEDLALGPCPTGSCLYVGDIGDAGATDATYSVHRLAEPQVALSAPLDTRAVEYETFQYQYPNLTKRNSETLLVHPTSGEVYIVTKTDFGQKSAVYKFPMPLVADSIATLVKVADLAVPRGYDLPITGGDIHPCGSAVLLRAYNTIYAFTLPAGTAFDAVFTSPVAEVPAASEMQGEAVAWLPSGRGYMTASEGANPKLFATSCP
jgi:hypothetical protein